MVECGSGVRYGSVLIVLALLATVFASPAAAQVNPREKKPAPKTTKATPKKEEANRRALQWRIVAISLLTSLRPDEDFCFLGEG